MLNIAICDDEETSRNHLAKLVTQYMNGKGQVHSIQRFSSGVETAKKLRELSDDVYLVFVTACTNYTLDGYKVNAFRYLVKHTDNFNEALEECLDAVLQRMNVISAAKRYPFIEGEKQFFLKRLVYIESNLHILAFHILEDDMRIYTLQKTLNSIEKDINDKTFLLVDFKMHLVPDRKSDIFHFNLDC